MTENAFSCCCLFPDPEPRQRAAALAVFSKLSRREPKNSPKYSEFLYLYDNPWRAGNLDARLPAALRILSAFGGTYRNRSPAAVHSTLSTLFDDVAVVPVTKAASSGPPLDLSLIHI